MTYTTVGGWGRLRVLVMRRALWVLVWLDSLIQSPTQQAGIMFLTSARWCAKYWGQERKTDPFFQKPTIQCGMGTGSHRSH